MKTIELCIGDVAPIQGRPCHNCAIKRECYQPLVIHNYSEEQRQRLEDRLDYIRCLKALKELV